MRNKLTKILSVFAIIPFVATPALAETVTTAGGYDGIGACVGLGIAAAGGAYGQSRVISAALDGIARNPGAASQMFMLWILGVAFVESLVIFTMVIALKLAGFF